MLRERQELREPRRAAEARRDQTTPGARRSGRFRIEPLEQRIAPFHCGGFGFGGCRACELTDGRVCQVFD